VGVGPSRASASRYKKVSCQAALEKPHNEAFAVPIVGRALDLGVNYIGTSSIDGGPEGWSEQLRRQRPVTFTPTEAAGE
jgi:hypothetical protein